MTNTDIRKIAIYVRVSTQRQFEEGCSLEVQENQCRKFVCNMGYTDVDIDFYCDGGKSGTTVNRADLQLLLKNINKGLYKMVVMYKFDRLTRNLIDFNSIIKLCNNKDCALIALDNPKIDLSNPVEKAGANVSMIFSQLQPELTSQRVKIVIKDKLERGIYPFGGKTAIGYERNENSRLVASSNIDEINVAKRIFFEMANAKSALQLASELTLEQALNRSWTDYAIIKMIKNKIYLGIIEWNGVTYKNMVEEYIIDKDLFDKANYYVGKAAKVRKYDYAYANLCVCNECGSFLQQKCTNKKGVIYHYYYCPKCKKRINEKILDNRLNDFTESLYNQEILNIEKGEDEKQIEEEIKRLKKVISNYYEIAVLSGTKEELKEYHDFKMKTDKKITYYNKELKKIRKFKRKDKKNSLYHMNNNMKCQLLQKYVKYIKVDLISKEIREIAKL